MNSFPFASRIAGLSRSRSEENSRRVPKKRRAYVPTFEGARHPLTASLVLMAFLVTQCIFPMATAYAQATSTPKRAASQMPAKKNAEYPRLAQRDKNAKAAPTEKSAEPGPPKPSARLRRANQKISLRSLDLSRPPTEKELREGGGMGGAMAPIGNADVALFEAELDGQLKQAGIPGGLRAQASPNSAPGRLLGIARGRVERAKAINWSFGKALDQRVKRNFDGARQMMRAHVEEFPDSPWVGEALLHLAMDAQYNKRPGEAQAHYETILNGTETDPVNPKLDPDDPRHGAYDVRQKAKVGWTDLDIMLGQWESATEKLHDILKTETDWRRHTWATSWMHRVALNSKGGKNLQACGPMALGMVLTSLGKESSAAQVRRLQPPRSQGFSLAELKGVAARHGVPMQGFKATAEQLADLPLPLIVHYDLSRFSASTNRVEAKEVVETKEIVAEKPSGTAQSPSAPVVAGDERHCDQCPPAEGEKAVPQVATPQVSAPSAPASKPASVEFCEIPQTKKPAPVVSSTKLLRGKPVINPSIRSASRSKSPFRIAEIGHFLVVEKVERAAKIVQVYDPLEKKRHRLSFAELEKEWSGYGLMLTPKTKNNTLLAAVPASVSKAAVQAVPNTETKAKTNEAKSNESAQPTVVSPLTKSAITPAQDAKATPLASIPAAKGEQASEAKPTNRTALNSQTSLAGKPLPTRVVLLSERQMSRIYGGCCCMPASPGDNGPTDENQPGDPNNPNPCGSPVWSVNRVSLNMYVQDVPLWYSTPVGPDVSIGMHYNSQASTNLSRAFGNKWMLSYASYLIENPDGAVHIFMPDSRQLVYRPFGGLYIAPPGELYTLIKVNQNHFEVYAPSGEVLVYQLPSNNPVLGAAVPTLVAIKDRRGYAIEFDFDNDGRMTTITDAQGKETKLYYEDEENESAVTRIKDPFGRQAHFQYDDMGNMVRVTDMEGAAANYTYTGYALISQLETARGTWNFDHGHSYLAWPQVWAARITVTDPLEKQEEFFWVGEMHDPGHVRYTDKRGAITRYYSRQTIGNTGKITQVVAPNQATTNLTYDYWTGKPATITDPKGRTSRFTYNRQGRVLTATDNVGRVTTFTYATNGKDLLSITNSRNQRILAATYNNYLQPLSVTQDPDNIEGLQATSYFTYTDWGAPATITDAKGDETVYTYDTAQQTNTRRLLSVAREGVTLGSITYDRIGRVRTVTDVSNLTTTYDYNDLNRLSRVTYPDGTYSEQDSSCCGTGGATRDRAGRMQYVDYDGLKRPVRMQDAAGNTLSLEYDFSGNLSQILDAKGNVTSFEYDGLNRLVRKAYSNHTSETFAYDEVGNLIAMRDAKNRVTRYNYDEETDELLNIDYPTMPDVSFTYDDLGQMTSMSDALGNDTALFTYDLLGRLKAENQPWNNDTVNYAYDELGRRSHVSIGYDDSYTVMYAFDSLGRPDSLTSPAGFFNYNYDDNSSRISSIYIPNASRASYWYDGLGRMGEVANLKDDGATISKYAYGFDAPNDPQRGVRTWIDKTMGTDPTQSTYFSYDAVNQLTSQYSSETPDPLVNIATTYDAMGNRVNHFNTSGGVSYISSYTTNRLNQYTQIANSWNNGTSTTTSTLSYDASGNLAQRSTVATGDGSPSHTQYVYDDLDRLTAVIKKNPTTGANVSKSEYVYDGFSRLRISKEFTWNGTDWDESYSKQKNRIYDGMDVIREQNVWGTNVATYVRDGNIGGLLSKENMIGERFYYHYDGSGNVVGMTDEQQNVVAEYTYDAWGTLLSSSGSEAVNNTYRFSTKEYFAETGLYNYGFRFYSPGMGRWINRDPLGESGGLNLYAAMANSPVNSGDAYGLYAESFIDLAFIAYDIYQIIKNPCDKSNWAALAADGAGLAIPGFTGGGLAARAAARTDDVVDFYHATSKPAAAAIRSAGPDLARSRKDLDFGPGFYTTKNLEQAQDWIRKRQDGDGEIIKFSVPVSEMNNFKSLNFPSANKRWGDFVLHHRRGGPMHNFDIVSGPMLGSKEAALNGVRPLVSGGQQTSWHTQAAVDMLMRYMQ